MYFVRNYELLTRVLWDIYQTSIVDCNRKSSPEKLRRTPDVVVHARLCGFWCSCQDVNLTRTKGMRSICEAKLVSVLSRKPRAMRAGVKLCITSLNSHFCWFLIWHKMLADVKTTMIEIKEEVISSVEVCRELAV